MSTLIHCRRRDGELKFKLWSTGVDGYLTSELTEQELQRWLMADALDKGYREVTAEWGQKRSVELAKTTGSNSMLRGDVCELDGPWRKEMTSSEIDEGAAPNLDGMFFLVSLEIRPAVQALELILRTAGKEEMKKFEAWAELSAFGEVYFCDDIYAERFAVVRVLPPP